MSFMNIIKAIVNVFSSFKKKQQESSTIETDQSQTDVVVEQSVENKNTQITANDLLSTLKTLSYDIDSDQTAAIKLFQKHCGFEQTGKLGPKTTEKLKELSEKLKSAPKQMKQMRKWRLTHYYIAEENAYNQQNFVPVYDKQKNLLAKVPASFFCNMALEGTGKLKDGRLLNVAGKPYVAVNPLEYESCRLVYNQHVRMMAEKNREPKPSGYFGISIKNNAVISVQAFAEVKKMGVGYGIGKLNVPYTPYKTIATDIGAYGSSEPAFKKLGGAIPAGTKVFILEFVGRKMPDGSIHDGWFVANDTGGGIFGAHIDVFTGTKAIEKQFPMPLSNGVAHIWFEGIENKFVKNYSYGLYDK